MNLYIKNLLLSFAFGSVLTIPASAELPERNNGHIYQNPVINYSTPDPTIIKDGRTFYLMCTESNHEVPVWKSTDLVNWTRASKGAFAQRPSFVKGGGIWAPDINKIGDKYVLYYAMSKWGDEWTCGIGVAIADRPEGPYQDRGKLFVSHEIGVQNCIDPFFISDNGHNYLFWGSFHGIYGTELTADGLQIKDRKNLIQIADNYMEATYIHKHNGWYFLFGSGGRCCEGDRSNYHIVVGRSRNLLGPYVNKHGKRLLDGHYSLLLHSSQQFVGPGHNAEIVSDDAGNDWMIYHSYVRGHADEGRQLLLDPIVWKNNWPVMQKRKPSKVNNAPVFK